METFLIVLFIGIVADLAEIVTFTVKNLTQA